MHIYYFLHPFPPPPSAMSSFADVSASVTFGPLQLNSNPISARDLAVKVQRDLAREFVEQQAPSICGGAKIAQFRHRFMILLFRTNCFSTSLTSRLSTPQSRAAVSESASAEHYNALGRVSRPRHSKFTRYLRQWQVCL
jgi:hypothetical protein